MERSFVFENFRNVGFEKEEKLVINHSLEKGKIGNLIVLIGPNNSGKSNVLDGILLLNEKKIDTGRNRTTLSFDPKFQTPKISLVTKDEKDIYSVTISSNQSNPVFKKPEPKKENLTVAQKKKALTEVCTIIINNCNNYNARSLG